MDPFTFTSAAASGSAAAGATSGSVTPWYKISGRIVPSSQMLTGTFVATIVAEYSNVADFDKGSDFAQHDQQFTTPGIREIPLGVGNYVRFRCTEFTSGTPIVSLADAIGAGWRPFEIAEDTKKTPTPSSAGS